MPVGVLHLVDTLDAGGAERVAVNLVNALPRARYQPHLCTTRRDGALDADVLPDVGRLRLCRAGRWDVSALVRLIRYIRENDIALLHAHATSLFLASLATLFPPYPALVWHDHYGNSALEQRSVVPFWIATRRVKAAISVSAPLAAWSRERLHLRADRVCQLPNFIRESRSTGGCASLPGHAGARIVCVANLRPQKDHITLLQAMARVVGDNPCVHLLLVGAENSLEHAKTVRAAISRLALDAHVSLLGSRSDVPAILRTCDIGVLSSRSEGFPLVLLEYGMAGLATVATRVGQCEEMLDDGRAGILVPPADAEALAEALSALLRAPDRRSRLGASLRDHVAKHYNERSAVATIGAVYEATLSVPEAWSS